ncbi:MAG TPA: D-glycero-beta-D-manno-heptose-7-phosphate kinase, partial [Desulfovibrio sp.]|nr:D-glycero-beta-D-manno-heptose-7-phosphate kinase [Desulfovibrio sp.]
LDLITASVLANHAAGLVVAQVGAATASALELAQAVEHLPDTEVNSWIE